MRDVVYERQRWGAVAPRGFAARHVYDADWAFSSPCEEANPALAELWEPRAGGGGLGGGPAAFQNDAKVALPDASWRWVAPWHTDPCPVDTPEGTPLQSEDDDHWVYAFNWPEGGALGPRWLPREQV